MGMFNELSAESHGSTILVKFFGKLPGQTNTDMLAEIKKLPDEDKAELANPNHKNHKNHKCSHSISQRSRPIRRWVGCWE